MVSLLVEAARAEECTGGALRPIPSDLSRPSDCTMDCIMKTYAKKILLHHSSSIVFKDSTQDGQGAHCWSTAHRCPPIEGESFAQAFVVVPANATSAAAEEVEVSTGTTKLSVHPPLPLISSSCGLLYEVTQYFSSENTDTVFCIRLQTRLNSGDGTPRCPPSLLVFWQGSSPEAHQQSGG
uniref:Uncharacterized protein n=1 Tax=Knipowitschia caucasica TaxID=637954 RepID=A0AAV2IR52_KNICA